MELFTKYNSLSQGMGVHCIGINIPRPIISSKGPNTPFLGFSLRPMFCAGALPMSHLDH